MHAMAPGFKRKLCGLQRKYYYGDIWGSVASAIASSGPASGGRAKWTCGQKMRGSNGLNQPGTIEFDSRLHGVPSCILRMGAIRLDMAPARRTRVDKIALPDSGI